MIAVMQLLTTTVTTTVSTTTTTTVTTTTTTTTATTTTRSTCNYSLTSHFLWIYSGSSELQELLERTFHVGCP